MRIHDSEQINTVLALYNQDIEKKDFLPSYQRLKTMTAKKFLDHKRRNQNFEARNDRTGTGKHWRNTEAKETQRAEKESSVRKEMLAVSDTILVNMGKGKVSVRPPAHALPHYNRRRESSERHFERRFLRGRRV